MSPKKQYSNRTNTKSTNGEKSYYKFFVLYSIILLMGIFLPQYFCVYYLEFSYMYIVVIPICFILGLYFKEGAFIHVTLGCILYNIFTIFFCKYCIYELSGCTFIYVRDRECRIQCLPLAALHFFQIR